MIKRGFATVLWFVTAWMLVSALDFAVALPFWVAPIVATAVATFIALDPRHVLWAEKIAASQGMPRT